MLFQRDKKKELWRYASKNSPDSHDGTTSRLPPLHRHRHQHPPQCCCNSLPPQQSTHSFVSSCCNIHHLLIEPITATNALHRSQLLNSPPPPYSSVPYGIDCSVSSINQTGCRCLFCSPAHYPMDGAAETSEYAIEKTDTSQAGLHKLIEKDSTCENYSEDMLIEESEQPKDSQYYNIRSKELGWQNSQPSKNATLLKTVSTSATTPTTNATTATTATTFVVSAANMFRNCCGGGYFSDSIDAETIMNYTTTQRINSKASMNQETRTSFVQNYPIPFSAQRQDFNILMKQLKNRQIAELTKAVKSRIEPPSVRSTQDTNSISVSVMSLSQCILLKRAPVIDEEPNVIACRLFFWSDLKNGSELKRLPVCPNAGDLVYVCCNPLHWCRILETDVATPLYRQTKMHRLKSTVIDENSIKRGKYTESSSITGSQGILSTTNNQSHCNVQIPDSITADSVDRKGYSFIWCQVAYWELSERVGALYSVRKPSINILFEGFAGDRNEVICLRDIVDQTSSPEAVQHTRQKIGLGITLSQEDDSVWVYNRAKVPIFVDSPTLSENFDRVCKIMPGYCLKAFDIQRARSQNPAQIRGSQLGPMNNYSMKISFAKGWGYTYKRQDIMRCPCWLEVNITKQR